LLDQKLKPKRKQLEKKTVDLLSSIDIAFQTNATPTLMEITVHSEGEYGDKSHCSDCQYLRDKIREWQNRTGRGEPDGFPVLDVYCLSATGMKWALPHYIRQCLKNGSYNNQMAERLIYHLHPISDVRHEVLTSLSLLDSQQISCLKLFVEWCGSEVNINEDMSDEIEAARQFLNSL
jgi:hypothetical protein